MIKPFFTNYGPFDINDIFMHGHLMSYLYEYASSNMDANIFHFIKQEELIKKLNREGLFYVQV